MCACANIFIESYILLVCIYLYLDHMIISLSFPLSLFKDCHPDFEGQTEGPWPVHTKYGDGTEIEDETISAIRNVSLYKIMFERQLLMLCIIFRFVCRLCGMPQWQCL